MNLQRAFKMQQEMRDRMIKERGLEFTDEQWMLNFLVAMEDEIAEVRGELNWKWWKNPKEVDMDATRDEIVDLWIFLIELTMSSGMSLKELEERFDAKTAENHARQNGTSSKPGYAISDISADATLPEAHRSGIDVDTGLIQRISSQISSRNSLRNGL